MNIAYAIYCRRVFPILAIISLGIVFMYFVAFTNATRQDSLLTKIFVFVLSATILLLLFSAYIFVYKQDNLSLTNGQATLWDTATMELADEICADCDTDEEKVKAIYEWMIHNFEYDYDCNPVIQYFNVRKTISTRKGICYDFSHLFAALCRSQNIPCYVVDGDKRNNPDYHHTWNRVYFDGSWWDMDITFDIVQTTNKGELYSLHKIEEIMYAIDSEYYIKRIY
ncbi:MAG: transglutaminase-like domain-containing protein [Oscillospiraceae bacterium]|nr:transglutaminase-like domain-containing protein [Oscillospiraceae bacterium]